VLGRIEFLPKTSERKNVRSDVLSRGCEPTYPGVFQEIREFIGDEATAKLVAQYGGTRIYIPLKLKTGHLFYQLLGAEIAHKLCCEFCGLEAEVPRDVRLQISQRNRLILVDRDAGMTQSQLAIKYHLTQRSIRTITSSQQRKEET
jgi:Mor family transcriptional regulator